MVAVEMAGLIFNAVSSLVGLVALYLAVKAYRVAEESYRVAKDQGRSAFELEVLRDLALRFDENDFAERASRRPDGPLFSNDVFARLAMIPRVELPLWKAMSTGRLIDNMTTGRSVDRTTYADDYLRQLFAEKSPSMPADKVNEIIAEHRWNLVADQLQEEVRLAIKGRVE
ncbi:hypothetical protein [Micromonospora sp. URMC 103]|uniref:hypothetical protein n=1 Tax=Micromonospora sp. URMC 103 TaxID=3423406 RepID=UPI003F1D4EAF